MTVSDRLSSSSYAVLGMLAIRPWTPYELTQQFVRSLAYCWPVSERQLYTEPEKLVAAGFATARPIGPERRARREYSITAEGRAELARWLGTAPAPPRVFSEPLLRVLFADQGEPADLLLALTTLRADIRQQMHTGRAQMLEYLDGRAPFPERTHLVAMFADLTDRIFRVIDEWSDEALHEVAKWPTTNGLGMTRTAKRQLQAVTRPVDPEVR